MDTISQHTSAWSSAIGGEADSGCCRAQEETQPRRSRTATEGVGTMRHASGPTRLRWLLVGALVSSSAFAQQPAGSADEQRRLELLGKQSRAVQMETGNQAFLVAFARRAALLYLHRLDSLSCRTLFGMGDEARFAASVGSADGTDHNRFFIEGDSSPRHLDMDRGGSYVFPSNTFQRYWPASATLNTYWHEVQHDLMLSAGIDVPPDPYRGVMGYLATETDGHHVLIEGVGQFGSEAYALLQPFEDAVRRADRLESQWIAEGRDPSDDYGLQRQAWGEAHQLFSAFLKAMLRVPVVPATALADYRAATGIFFSSPEKVAEFYRTGGLKRLERGEALAIRPPTWVFWPDLFLMPVQVLVLDANRRDLEEAGALAKAPSETKNGTFRQTFTVSVKARGSAYRMKELGRKENLLVGNTVRRGTLRLRIVEEDTLVRLTISQGTSATVDGDGPRKSFFVLDLATANSQPVKVTFVRRALSKLNKPTTYHVTLEYTDPDASKLYYAASAQLSFTLGTGSGAPGGTAGGSTASAAAAVPAVPAPAPAASATSAAGATSTRTPVGVKVSWGPLPSGLTVFKGGMYDKGRGLGDPPVLPSPGEMEMVNGATAFLERGDRKTNFVIIELYGMVYDRTYASLQEYLSIQFPPGSGKYGPTFDHSETRIAGLRAFESIGRRWSELGGQHHYVVELDPQRHLYASILSDMHTHASVHTDLVDVYTRDVTQFIAGLRFTLSAAQALALTKSVPLPLPKALTGEPIVDNEIEQRPPPPPDAGGGSGRRRSGAAQGATATTPTSPTAPGTTGGAAATGVAATGTPTPGAAPGTTSSGVAAASSTTTGTGVTGVGATATGATTAAVASAAANAAGALSGRGSLEFNGGVPSVKLANDGRNAWTQCTVVAPGRRSYSLGTLPAGSGRDVPIKEFKPDSSAPALTTKAVVQCAEGTLDAPANLASVSPEALAAALTRSAQEWSSAATDAAKKAADAAKKALGGWFRKP